MRKNQTKPQAQEVDLTIKTRVDRTCPRCRFHGYHDGNYMGRRNKISCVNCGHVWTGRIMARDV